MVKSWPMKKKSAKEVFVTKLKQCLESKEETAYSLAEKTGLSNPAIYSLKDGRNDPSLTTVEKIANALGYSVAEFLSSTEKIDHDVDECFKRVSKEWAKRG